MNTKPLAALFFVFAVGCGGAAASPEGAPSPSGSPVPDRVDSVSSMSGDATSGRGVFAAQCSQCHGGGGKGGIGPNLTGVDEGTLVSTLIHGRSGGMPSFSRLSDQELADVSAFVMQLE